MNQIELFAGIGGFGLAGRWAGIETICQVEIDPFCQKVLQKNFPNAQRHADIKNFDGTKYFGAVDIISGGFPCQPYSTAGKRLGKEDERHLWPEMLRVIREARPRWVVGENVGGLISWSGGLVFEEVCADLEAIGYEVQPFVLPACSVDAPHRRDRIWFVANTTYSAGQRSISKYNEGTEYESKTWAAHSSNDASNPASERRKEWQQDYGREDATEIETRMESEFERFGNKRIDTNSNCSGRKKHNPSAVSNWPGFSSGNVSGIWEKWTSEPAICGMDDGISAGLDKHRNKRIKALGNAIVPQVAYQIFSAIKQLEE